MAGDVGGNNVYDFILTATATAGGLSSAQSHARTITNVAEGATFAGTISVPTQTVGVPMSNINVASFFTAVDAGDTGTYSLDGGAVSGLAVSANGSTFGGTATTAGSYTGRRIARLGSNGVTVYSNTFTVTVNAGGGDTTVPTLTGSLTVTAITPTGYNFSYGAGADNVGVVAYDRSYDGGATWVDIGNVTSGTATGRAPGSVDLLRIRARDAAGNVSTPALAASVPLGVYSMTIGPFGVAGVQQNSVVVAYSLSAGKGPGDMSIVKQGSVTTDGTTGLATITHTAAGQAVVVYSPVAAGTFDVNKHTCVRYGTLAFP